MESVDTFLSYLTVNTRPALLPVLILLTLLPLSWSQTTTVENVSTQSTTLTDTELQDLRLAEANLSAHLQSLPVSKHKIPPVTSSAPGGVKVVVNMTLSVISVSDISDLEQTMSTLAEIHLFWRDEALTWNVSEHGGVQKVHLPVESVWLPSIVFINSLDFANVVLQSSGVDVTNDGTVYAYAPLWRDTVCKLDHSKYPYDTQFCPLQFISHLTTINLLVNIMKTLDEDLTERLPFENQWRLTDIHSSNFVGARSDEIIGKTVMLELRRKSLFFVVCLVLPMVLTSYMNTLVFLVPLQSGEKVSYLVTIFVSTSVFITFIKDIIPRGLDSLPMAMKFVLIIIVGSFVVLIATLIVMQRFYQEQAEMDKEKLDHIEKRDKKASCEIEYRTSTSDAYITRATSFDKNIPPPLGSVLRENSSTSRITPVHEGGLNEHWKDAVKGGNKPKLGRCAIKLTAQRLDHLFFVTSFLGNSVFVIIFLSEVW